MATEAQHQIVISSVRRKLFDDNESEACAPVGMRLEVGAEDGIGWIALHHAARCCTEVEITRILIEEQANVKAAAKDRDNFDVVSTLIQSIRWG